MTSRRKIMFVQPNAEIGGSDIALLRTVEALDLARIEPLVVTPEPGPFAPAFKAAGARQIVVPMQLLRTLPSVRYQAGYLARFLPTVLRLRRLIRDERPDLVHSNSLYCLYGAWAAKLSGVRHLWHVREIPPQLPVLTSAYVRMVYGLSSRVVFMTQDIRRRFGEAAEGSAKSRVLYDAVDLASWTVEPDRAALRSEIGAPPDAQVVTFVGRLDPWKGAHVFVDAAIRLSATWPAARFVVCGGPPPGFEAYADGLRSKVTAAGLDDVIRFLGFRPAGAPIARLMASSDVLCHCSVNPEPFGLVVIEGMALGRPVVAAAAGGPLEIITDGIDGVLAPPGDPAVLADAIAPLLSDRSAADRIGLEARRTVAERFSQDRFKTDLDALYEDIWRTPQ
jgi:glycosyltransferase involved in cell wall biosynthesis